MLNRRTLSLIPMVGRIGLVGLVGLAGTACGPEANYTLQLRPVVPLNQDPFSGDPRVWVGIHDADDGTSWSDFDTLGSGSARETGFGPLSGDRIGVALGGSDDPDAAPDSVLAYGETPPLDLADSGEELDLGVLIAESNALGALSTLDEPAYGAALAMLDDGRAYAFGGIRIEGGACSQTIRRMEGLNTGDWVFEELRAVMPEGLCYAVATVIQRDGREHILVTGGETVYNGHNQRSTKAFLFDPIDDTIVETASGTFSRARHTVAPLPDGRLLLVGTHQFAAVAPTNGSWEVFDPESFEFGAYGTASVAPWDFMAAPIPGGVALCGGGSWIRSTVTPLSACVILRGDGSETPLPSLPRRTRAGAMTRLADGRLLVVGGINTEGQAGSPTQGTDAAFVLDLESDDPRWEEIGKMNEVRTYPVLLADEQGGAVVIGGAEAAWGFAPGADRPAACGERLVVDGDELRFETLDTCAEGGTGVLPSVSVHPSFGALMLEGRNGDRDGAQAIGFWTPGP